MREEREREENKRERRAERGETEKGERMPLFVNQSAVSERENSENPQRKEEDEGGRVGGYLQLLQRITELLWSAVHGGPRIASSCGRKTRDGSEG